MSGGARFSFDLANFMQLNLVHRRLTMMARGDAFVHPQDLQGLVEVLDGVMESDAFQTRDLVNDLRRRYYDGR